MDRKAMEVTARPRILPPAVKCGCNVLSIGIGLNHRVLVGSHLVDHCDLGQEGFTEADGGEPAQGQSVLQRRNRLFSHPHRVRVPMSVYLLGLVTL